jgi:hypothetical protein
LREDTINLALDLDLGTYSFNFTTYVSIQGGYAGSVPVVTVEGQLGFASPQSIVFSAPNISVCCTQPTSPEIALCPYIAQLLLGTWSFDYHLTASATDWMSINTGIPIFNSNGVPQQFMGMNVNPTFFCAASPCASLADQVPRPENVSYMVRRFLLSYQNIAKRNSQKVSVLIVTVKVMASIVGSKCDNILREWICCFERTR